MHEQLDRPGLSWWCGWEERGSGRDSVAGVFEHENLEDPQQQKLQWVHGSGASCCFLSGASTLGPFAD